MKRFIQLRKHLSDEELILKGETDLGFSVQIRIKNNTINLEVGENIEIKCKQIKVEDFKAEDYL